MITKCRAGMTKQPDRMIALDVLRGLTILLMIIVNNPGSWEYIYAPLRHAPWDLLALFCTEKRSL